MKINKELLKGSMSIMILSMLNRKDMYGYQIMQELKMMSDNTFELKEGTLYPLLHALENDNSIECYWFDTDEGRRRKYYKITAGGKEVLAAKRREWNAYVEAVNSVIGGALNEGV